MNRRSFLPFLGGGFSGSFLLGTLGGGAAGASAAVAGINARQSWARLSHSQQGEDLIVESICRFLKIETPVYLDIGAADPIVENNTYLFYQKGSHGVLVEPNPAFGRKLEVQRPRDIVLNVGVGYDNDLRESDYFMVSGQDGSYLNTFSKEEAEIIVSKSHGQRTIEKVVKMPLVNINAIIDNHFPKAPDFVSIDTEGLDLDILKSFDFDRYRPAVFCVETLMIGTMRVKTEILELMKAKGYGIRSGTFVNTIFVDDSLIV
jgi:FkbM family methyltransferase